MANMKLALATFFKVIILMHVDKWMEAMSEELSLESHSVQKVNEKLETTKDREAVGLQWVVTIQLLAIRCVERYKTSVVVKEFSQMSVIEFIETFAIVTCTIMYIF